LDAWQTLEYKKVKKKIQEVIDRLAKVEEESEKINNQEVISFSANKRIKNVVQIWNSFFVSLNDYKLNPTKYKARPNIPNIPNYLPKGCKKEVVFIEPNK
jgi:hypothetical protein